MTDRSPSAPEEAEARSSSLWARLRRRLRGRDEDGTVVGRLTGLDEDYVREKADEISAADLDTIVERADAIEERFRSGGPLRRFVENGRLLLALVRDVRAGDYRDVPVWTLSAVGVALLYVLNPFDLIPDVVPFFGLIDDVAVVSACLSLVEQDLRGYREWRQEKTEMSDSDDWAAPETLPAEEQSGE